MNKLHVTYHIEEDGIPQEHPTSVKAIVVIPYGEHEEAKAVQFIAATDKVPAGAVIVVHESHDPRREYIEHERTCGYCHQTRIEKEKLGILFDKGPSTWRRYAVLQQAR